MGGRRDGERERQRERCRPKMYSILRRNAESDEASEGKVCEMRESVLKTGQGFIGSHKYSSRDSSLECEIVRKWSF